MVDIVKQVIDFYIKSGRKPNMDEIKVEDKNLLTTRGSVFVTLYHKGEIRGSAGNIKEIDDNLYMELVNNTIQAIAHDPRFSPLSPKEAAEIKIRVDLITGRELLKERSIKDIDPATSGVIVIKADYSTMATILPNINPKLINGQDFIPVLKNKTKDPSFDEKNYIVYEIKTEMKTSF